MGRVVVSNVKNPDLVRDRRRQLVEAALAVFLRKGYHRAAVRDIGREAGFTQGTIYNYVRSKSDILYLVCDDVMRSYQDAAARAVERVADPGSRLSTALHDIVAAADAHQDAIRLLFQESHALDRRSLQAILGRVAEYIEAFERLLVDAMREGRVVPMAPRVAANIVTFLPTMVALRHWDLHRRVATAAVLRDVTEFLMRGLGAGEADRRSGASRRGSRAAAARGDATRMRDGQGAARGRVRLPATATRLHAAPATGRATHRARPRAASGGTT